MKIDDVIDKSKFYSLIDKFINDKRSFHEFYHYVKNNSYLNDINENYKHQISKEVYRGVYFWNDDDEFDESSIRSIPSEIASREKQKTNLNGVSYSSCSHSYEVAEKFSKWAGDFGFVITFNVDVNDILLVPLAFKQLINDHNIISTLEYEKEVIVNPNTSRIRRVARVRR